MQKQPPTCFIVQFRELISNTSCRSYLLVAYTLDTDSCINAIRRFICRRGTISTIRSDNGTNFVGANQELKESLAALNHNKIQTAFVQDNIKWTNDSLKWTKWPRLPLSFTRSSSFAEALLIRDADSRVVRWLWLTRGLRRHDSREPAKCMLSLYFLCHARLMKHLNVSSICLVLSWLVLTHATRPGGTPTLVDLDLEWGVANGHLLNSK